MRAHRVDRDEHRLCDLGGLQSALGQVARIMPAAVEGDLHAVMFCDHIVMASFMDARYRVAAALAEQEVDDLKEAFNLKD